MWVATFHTEGGCPHVIARHKYRRVVEVFAERFVARIPHPEAEFYWVTFKEEPDGGSHKHL